MKLDDLVDSLGRPIPKEMKDDLNEAIVRTIAHPDSDVSAVVKRAQTIARRALDGEIGNVLHYATKALFAVARKQQRLDRDAQVSSESPETMIDLAGPAVDGSPSAIQARILLAQLLDTLGDLERKVFVRYTMGWKHTAIAKELGISVAMSSYYLLRAKVRLDQAADAEQSAGDKEFGQ